MATLLQTRTARLVRGVFLGVLLIALVSVWVLPVASVPVRMGLSALIALVILTSAVWTVLITEWIWDRRAKAPDSTGPLEARDETGRAEPSVTWERVEGHARGPLIVVRFDGFYPRGSEGNGFAKAMVDRLASVLAETEAAGVVLDLTNLDYAWGDAIAGLAMPLRRSAPPPADGSSRKVDFRPAAAVARGPTAQALGPLFGAHFLLGAAGVRLFPTTREAVIHVEEALLRAE